jgi:hypothetical protein
VRPGPPEPGRHGPDEIYDKFTVVKTKHVMQHGGIKTFAAADELTHGDEWIFTVRPETNDGAAVAAIEAYAKACRPTYPGLADALERRLDEKGLR